MKMIHLTSKGGKNMKRRKFRTLFTGMIIALCSVFVMNTGQECKTLAAENVFEMTPGGSIRIAEPYGLRFQVKMSADIKENADKVGMLIFPADYLVDNGTDGDVYYDSVEALAKTNVTSHRINLDLTSKLYEKDGYWYGNGAIVNIKEKNMAREFVGIAYYEVDDNITFADTSKVKDTTRSAAQVALLTHADKTNEFSDETDKLLVKYIDHLKLSGVEDSAPSRYKVRGYAVDNGLRFNVVQYVDNLISTGDAWTGQTHLEAQIWQHNMGQGVQYGLNVDTYCAFWLDGSSWFNNYENIKNVTNQVTISDKGEDSAADYRYEICYEIFIEFDNNLENPADGPYAFVQFKHHMPGEEVEGFENARKEHRDDNRYLWQDKSESSWFRSTGIVEQQMGISRFQEQIKDRKLQWLEKGNDGRTTLFIGDSFFDPYFWSNFYTESYLGKDALVLGIGSTTTYDWETWATEWLKDIKPKNIVMHMGTNNIYDDGDDVEATVSALKNMFAVIHENVPDTPIYWFGISYRSYGDAKIEKTTEVNNQIKEWCEEQDYMTYIDTPNKLTNDMLFDGTHPAPEYYYVFKDALAETDIVIEDSLLTVETDASTRYDARGYAANEGLYFNAVQYVDKVVSTGDVWLEQTHLEAEIWQHNIGYGFGGTYFRFGLDGSYEFNAQNEEKHNVKNVTCDVTVHDRGADYTDGYRYAVLYEIFIEFDNNLENPADGPYAYVQFKHHMPSETEEGFENSYKEHRDSNRHLWQDYCNSYEFRATGIVKKDIPEFITLKSEGTLSTVTIGETIWTDKTYTFYEMPSAFIGATYVENTMKSQIDITVNKRGYIYVLTPYRGHSGSIVEELEQMLYDRVETPAWYLASFTSKVDTWVYEREVDRGETITIPSGGWHILVVSETRIDPTVHTIGDYVFSNDEMAVLEPTEASGDTVDVVEVGTHPFSNRTSGTTEATFSKIPYCMQGKSFIYNMLNDTVEATVTKAGKVLLLGSTNSTRKTYFTETLGFTYIGDMSSYAIINGGSYSTNGYGLYIKDVTKGETITWGNGFWFVPMFYSDVKLPAEPPVSIEITQMPDKTTYQLGEDFDSTGMVVVGTDKYGNKTELRAEDYVTVPTTFTADVYAAAVIVDDMVAAVPVTITDTEGNELVDTKEYSTEKYSTQKAPLLNGSVKRSTVAEVIATIQKMEEDGATAFNVHLTELSSEYQNGESFRQIAECTKYPVMAIAYGNNDNVEWRMDLMKKAVGAGFDIVDIPMNTYDSDSRSSLAGTIYESANPQEVSMNEEIIVQQKALIKEFKNMGAEVLISAHIGVSLTEEQGVALAKEMESRGADVAKIVLGSNVDQKEVMQTNLTLKNEVGIKFYYNASGNASRPYRTASTLLGSHMVFCYAEYHPSNLAVYDYIVDLVEFYKTIPKLNPLLKVNNSAILSQVAVGAAVWTDKDYVFTSLPKAFIGKTYVKASYETSGETVDVKVLRSGYLYVLTNAYKLANSQGEALDNLNYEKLDLPTWQFCNFTATTTSVWVYEKYVEAGETLQLGRWSVVIASDKKLDLTDNGGYTVPDSQMAVVKSLSNQVSQTLEVGEEVFCGGTTSSYYFYGVPYWLAGKNYIVSNYSAGGELEVTRAGTLYMMANATNTRNTYFTDKGFTKAEVPSFEPFGGSFKTNGFAIYEKQVEVGETITWDKWAIPIYSGELILSNNMAMLSVDGDVTKISKFEFHARLFNDRTYYETTGSPEQLYGKSYLYAGIDNDGGETAAGTVTKAGTVYIQIPTKNSNSTYVALEEQLLADGFTQTPYRTYRNNRSLGYAQRLYQKEVEVGDIIHYGKYNLVFFDTLENEEDYYVMPSLTVAAEIINNPQGDEYVSSNRNWQGCPVITQTKNGRLWAGWFTGGKTELSTGNHAVLLYSDDNGQTWVDPAVAIVHPDTAAQVTKPQVWVMDDGRLWVSWTQHTGTGGFDGKMGTWAAICENPDAAPEDLIWSEPTRLFDGRGNGKITVLGSGEWLTTAFDWMERDYSKVYSSTDEGKTWVFKGKAEVTGSEFNNSILIERKDSTGHTYLWMLMRQLTGPMKESFSYDGGVTWTNGKSSSIDHPNSAIYMSWTSTGKLLMINHKDFTGRNNLTAFLSDDGGETWDYTLLLDERTGVSYPDVVEGADGTFYIVYDYDRFNTGQMYMATVTEEDIMAGEFQSSGAKQKIRFSSLGINGPQVSDSLQQISLSDKFTWASSTGDLSGSAHAAFDGNDATRWCASDSSFPQTLTVDLGELKDIANVNILFEQEGEWKYTIRISEDGVTWNNYATNPTEIPRQQEYRHEAVAQARYVSIDMTSGGLDANSSPCWASIWEMSVSDAEGNNLALNQPCKATSIVRNGSGAEMAFDGNEDTRYCASSSSLPQKLMIDLEDVYDIGAIYMFFEQKSDWDYTLETSLDGITWDIYAQPGSQRLVDVTETKDAEARYVRLTVNGTTDGAWASVWEMKVYSYKK